jgi:hypothetical protein
MVTGEPDSRNWLLAFFSHPVVGIIGSLASVIGIPLAIYFYFQSSSQPELVCYVNPARAEVVKQGAASRLTVSFDGQPIGTDVTAAQVAVWNRGRRAVRPETILEPFVIRTEPSVPILEATIRKTSRDVIALKIDRTRLAKGEVPLSWAILEQDDAGIIQLVYAAGADTKIQCQGVIEGQRAVRELKYGGKIRTAAEQIQGERRFTFVLVINMIVGIVVMVIGLGLAYRAGLPSPPRPLGYLAFLICGFVTVFSIYLIIVSSVPVPPVGFD